VYFKKHNLIYKYDICPPKVFIKNELLNAKNEEMKMNNNLRWIYNSAATPLIPVPHKSDGKMHTKFQFFHQIC